MKFNRRCYRYRPRWDEQPGVICGVYGFFGVKRGEDPAKDDIGRIVDKLGPRERVREVINKDKRGEGPARNDIGFFCLKPGWVEGGGGH